MGVLCHGRREDDSFACSLASKVGLPGVYETHIIHTMRPNAVPERLDAFSHFVGGLTIQCLSHGVIRSSTASQSSSTLFSAEQDTPVFLGGPLLLLASFAFNQWHFKPPHPSIQGNLPRPLVCHLTPSLLLRIPYKGGGILIPFFLHRNFTSLTSHFLASPSASMNLRK